ncbi:hypothetical protein DYB32_005307 [Aphanomyces invadans]|uniref:Ion transport domain-containing protein n=1 Tax=Aphanomyces invadans TaxID=157072 RepID=A0A418AUX5_9STRA|nr:hypothetical protein DYB32_005307 [Aphanomyces invadans]
MRPEAYAEVHVESESEDSTPRVLSPTRRVNKKVDEHAQQAKVPAASSAMDNVTLPSNPPRRWRQGYQKLYETLYMTNTREGQRCNVILMVLTIVSVTVAVLDSVTEVREAFNNGLVVIEMLFTLLFSVEYALRLLCLQRPSDYATSIYGIVDMVSILPTYLDLMRSTQTSVSLGGMGFQVMHCPSSPACKPFMNLHQDDAKFCRKCGAKLSVFL